MINVVIDISHYNENVDFQKAKSDGILGVIHKATQGDSYIDPTYSTNRQKALDAGLLWGAYHFGTGVDANKQVEHFFSVIGDDPTNLLVLDFEANPGGSSMSLDQAHAFVTQVQQITGRYPGFYSGSYIKDLLGSKKDSILVNCWFWLAQYGSNAVVQVTWPTWTMWQYTDGSVGPEPHSVNGIGNCDRDKFNGDETHLRKLWLE